MSFDYDESRDATWRARLHERLARLVDDPRFEVVAAHAGETFVAPAYPIYPSDIALRWFEREGEAQGELHWLALEPIGGDRVSPKWFEAGSGEFLLAKQLWHFEDHPEGGEGIMVLATGPGQLYMHDSGRGVLLPLAVSFEDYIELQIATLGLGGVLDALVELREHGWSAASESTRYAQEMMATQHGSAAATLAVARRLFADQDLGILERRVEALAKLA